MITDQQFRRLMKLSQTEETLALAAAKAGMDEKTARKWRQIGKPPSEVNHPRTYRTRPDPFAEVWEQVEQLLERDASLEAKTIFDHLCRQYPERFQESQLRTLQRRVKIWRARKGAPREVMFPQEHVPGRQAQSDFTYLSELLVTIAGQVFKHLFYHFTLVYSNWEWGMVCASESWESLSEGLQQALWKLGGVPAEHRTDSLAAAVKPAGSRDEFTERYQGLLRHYGMRASHTTPGRGHENGDVEQSHHRFKRAVEQELLLRGSRDARLTRRVRTVPATDVNEAQWAAAGTS
jgi:transposase